MKVVSFLLVIAAAVGLSSGSAAASRHGLGMAGRGLFVHSGCLRCHTLGYKKSKYDSLVCFGNRGLSVKEAEKAIRSCRMDDYCSGILNDSQVKDIAYFLNSLKCSPTQDNRAGKRGA